MTNFKLLLFFSLKIAGDGGIGKSCLMNRFVSNQFDENSFHTIGVEFLNKDIEIDGHSYTLQVNFKLNFIFFFFINDFSYIFILDLGYRYAN